MRRVALLTLLWLAAGSGALTLGWAGVATVGNQVTGSRPSPLSAAQVREELARTTTSLDPEDDDGPLVPPPEGSAEPDAATPPTSGAVASDPRAPPRSSPTSSTTTTTLQSAPAAVTRSYALRGGSVTLRFAPSGVTVQSATPNPGFSVEVEPEQGNGVQVEFRNDHLRSRVKGWWEAGPRDEVREDDD